MDVQNTEMKALDNPIKNQVENVFVHVSDLQTSARWYSRLLGIRVHEHRFGDDPEPVYWFGLQGGTSLILDDNRVNKQRESWNDSEAPQFMYGTDDIQKVYEAVRKHGAEITREIEAPHQGLSFFNFKDIEGNVFMVCCSDYNGALDKQSMDHPIENRIGAVFINVKNLNQSAQWHCDLLHVPYHPVEDTIYEIQTEKGAGILLDINRHLQGHAYEVLFMFMTEDIKKAYDFVVDKGIEVFTDIEGYGDVSFFTIKDPDENVLMVCQNMNA